MKRAKEGKMVIRFRDRTEAGRLLAGLLLGYANRPDVLVLALPRGGVPVAFEVAYTLNAPLDLFLVRKLGVPEQKELAMGAIASGGGLFLNKELIELLRIPGELLNKVVEEEQKELDRRERLYRCNKPAPDLRNKTVILIDDGIATGSTILAAINAIRQYQPARIVVAVPTASISACNAIKPKVDELVCIMTPEPFSAVGLWYQDFYQTTDEDVRNLLEKATQRVSAAHHKRRKVSVKEL
jgi:putative phosphoribosyl transferase